MGYWSNEKLQNSDAGLIREEELFWSFAFGIINLFRISIFWCIQKIMLRMPKVGKRGQGF
jgi:hypothetical protein